MSINIADKAMLTRLSISQWTARKHDKRVDREVADTHGTQSDAGRYNKVLIAGEALKAIVSAAGDARTYHYSVTLPWTDEGVRILPAALYFPYMNTIRDKRAAFDASLEKFVDAYPVYIEDARRRLNGLFVESDYPTVNEIRRRFSFEQKTHAIPSAADFRVSLQGDEIAKIRAEIEAGTSAAVAAATQDIWDRAQTAIAHMSERLRAYQTDAQGKVIAGTFRDTLVTNLQDQAALIPGLNITGDPRLDALAGQITAKLCAVDPQTLRDSPTARAEVAADADAILAQMAGYCAAA